MRMKTIAERTAYNGRNYQYTLTVDAAGFYWVGMECKSWRRKTRKGAEDYAQKRGYDIKDIEY